MNLDSFIGKWLHISAKGFEHHPRFFVWGTERLPDNLLTIRIEKASAHVENPKNGKHHVAPTKEGGTGFGTDTSWLVPYVPTEKDYHEALKASFSDGWLG